MLLAERTTSINLNYVGVNLLGLQLGCFMFIVHVKLYCWTTVCKHTIRTATYCKV